MNGLGFGLSDLRCGRGPAIVLTVHIVSNSLAAVSRAWREIQAMCNVQIHLDLYLVGVSAAWSASESGQAMDKPQHNSR